MVQDSRDQALRHDGRRPDELRPVEIVRGFTRSSPGSVLIGLGHTRVLCTASIVREVPGWRAESGAGWITAEYEMLPGSTGQRRPRSRNRLDGRTVEIQRLIGRSLRAVIGLEQLGPHTIYLDCDVLEADGGTRTAAITAAWVALHDAIQFGAGRGLWPADVLSGQVAAISAGIVGGRVLLDLDYHEDSAAEVDGNFVMTDAGAWVEVQTTAEAGPFSDAQLAEMLAAGRRGIERLFEIQRRSLERMPLHPYRPPPEWT